MVGRNRLFLWLTGMAFCVSFVGLFVGHTLLHYSHQDHLFLHSLRKKTSLLSWKPLLEKVQNKTISARRACNEMTTTRRHDTNLMFPVKDIQQHCHYPPSTECFVSDYSILMVSQPLHLRTLFLNLLRSLTLPHVSCIHVVLLTSRSDAMKLLKRDVKYGQRILNWHEDTSHKIVLSFHGEVPDISHGAVVLLDGSVRNVVGNRRVLEFGFDVWKRHSDSLVARHSHLLTKRESTMDTSDSIHNYVPFVPVCQGESLLVALTQENDMQSNSLLRLPEFSGMWIHSDFLCLLRQLPLLTTKNDFKLTFSVWLMQVARLPIHTYPPRLSATDYNSLQRRDSSWIDDKILTRLVRDFGGMPATLIVEWCADKVTGKPKLCTPTASTWLIDNTRCMQ